MRWLPLGNGAGWEDPLGRLAGDEIEVAIVVQYDEPGSFGRRSDEQVCDLCSALVASIGHFTLFYDARCAGVVVPR